MWADRDEPIVISTRARTRTLDDDLVVYHAGTDAVSHLDPIARAVWEFLQGQPTFGELVHQLATHFHAEVQTIEVDVAGLLDELLKSELITIGPEAPSPVGQSESL